MGSYWANEATIRTHEGVDILDRSSKTHSAMEWFVKKWRRSLCWNFQQTHEALVSF